MEEIDKKNFITLNINKLYSKDIINIIEQYESYEFETDIRNMLSEFGKHARVLRSAYYDDIEIDLILKYDGSNCIKYDWEQFKKEFNYCLTIKKLGNVNIDTLDEDDEVIFFNSNKTQNWKIQQGQFLRLFMVKLNCYCFSLACSQEDNKLYYETVKKIKDKLSIIEKIGINKVDLNIIYSGDYLIQDKDIEWLENYNTKGIVINFIHWKQIVCKE